MNDPHTLHMNDSLWTAPAQPPSDLYTPPMNDPLNETHQWADPVQLSYDDIPPMQQTDITFSLQISPIANNTTLPHFHGISPIHTQSIYPHTLTNITMQTTPPPNPKTETE